MDFSYNFFVLGPIRTRALSLVGPFVFSYQACFVLIKVWDYAVRARTLPAPEPSGDSHQTLVIRAHGMIYLFIYFIYLFIHSMHEQYTKM